MRKILNRMFVIALCLLTLTGLRTGKVSGAESTTKTYISLGADLTQEQRSVVLSGLGLTEEDLENCVVTYVTNSMEQEYLGSYLSSDVIGTAALSCAKVIGRKEGYGIHVTTSNINYCTAGMYENALATAGVKNADVYVTGPAEISGTAALIGVMQAYDQMTGTALDAESVDAATNELVATGIIADTIGDSKTAEKLIAVVKDAVVSKGITDPDTLRQIILQAADELGITLSEEEIQTIISLMQKIASLDLSADDLKQQIGDIYSMIQDLNITDEEIQNFWDEFGGYFVSFWNHLCSYLADFFGF